MFLIVIIASEFTNSLIACNYFHLHCKIKLLYVLNSYNIVCHCAADYF